MEEVDIIENGLYRLDPEPGKELRTWCRHNLLVATKKDGKWKFTDTYWGSMGHCDTGDSTWYPFDEIKDRITFGFDLNHAVSVSENEWMQYDNKDRFYIPIGVCSEQHFVDSRKPKSREIIGMLLQEKIKEIKADINSKILDLLNTQKTLDRVENGGSLDHIYIK